MNERSTTGAELINGAPYFGVYGGVRMNRTEYLVASADERKAAFIEELLTPEDDWTVGLPGEE